MIDREKVIKGLECCILHNPDDHARCMQCPYESNCVNRLKMDALALLKEQQETASEWLEDSDPGQVYGTTWACFKCKHGIHKPFVWNPYDSKMVYCPFCGARMYREVKQDDIQ